MEGDKNELNNFLNQHVRVFIERFISNENVTVKNYKIAKASDKMLGYLGDYWKLRVDTVVGNTTKTFHFFVKSVSRSNPSKAAMVTEMKLFEKEAIFYERIKPRLEIPGIEPWSPKLAAILKKDLFLEDLTASGYTCRNKFENFNLEIFKRALEAVARFHAGSIVYEENVKRSGRPSYTLRTDFELDKGGYIKESSWFTQCFYGSLEVMREFSKYKNQFHIIEKKWSDIWYSALELSNEQAGCRNVICHRDLWNNNLLYHYDSSRPESCVLVDFQAISYQPPAGDITLLLYCSNIDSATLDKVIPYVIEHYHAYMAKILKKAGISIDEVLPIDELRRTVEEQRKWGLVLSCCLFPQMIIDDDKVTEIFTDTKRFERIMTKEKGKFIKSMIEESKLYKEKVLERFEEVVWRYIPEAISNS